jgi:MFS transporter, Spinster family, sphingosine-1-phosphate transporter
MPTAHSLIADHFTRAERPKAVARYMLGGPLSIGIAFLLGGWLNEFYGWRMTFVLLGLPGVVLAVLAWLTLKEPRLEKTAALFPNTEAMSSPDRPSLKEVCVTLWNITAFRHLVICFAVFYFFNFGIAKWLPAFFIRSYGLQTGELGTWFTLIYGLGGLLGTWLGGEWAYRRAAHNERLQLMAMALAYCLLGACMACAYLSTSQYVAFGLMGVVAVAGATTTGPLYATIQTLVPQRMRAMALATILFAGNLIGAGFGPLAAGVLSDALRPFAGEESLRYALLALCPGYLWGAWHLWRASHSVTHDLKAIRSV